MPSCRTPHRQVLELSSAFLMQQNCNGVPPMCDYSSMHLPNRLATEGDLVAHCFPGGRYLRLILLGVCSCWAAAAVQNRADDIVQRSVANTNADWAAAPQ